MVVKLLGKYSHSYSFLAWLKFYIDWTTVIQAKGMSALNKLTNQSIIAETMRMSLQRAQEAMKNSVAVTYNLALQKSQCKFKKKNP